MVTLKVAPCATFDGNDLVTVPVLCVPTVTVDDAMFPVLVSGSLNVPLMTYVPAAVGATRVYVKLPLIRKNLCVPLDVVVFNTPPVLTSVNPEGIVSSI